VHMLGWRRDVVDLLHAMDIFLLTSHFEGLPRAVLQAMAAGVPVVATDVDGTPEVVRDRHTGLLVAAQDPPAVAESLLELAGDPVLRSALADRAKRVLDADFDIHNMVASLEQIYISQLEGSGCPE